MGIVILDSLPLDHWTQERLGMVWLGIGAHLGETVEANDAGDFCCEVTDKPGTEAGRGFASNVELGYHNDGALSLTLILACILTSSSPDPHLLLILT